MDQSLQVEIGKRLKHERLRLNLNQQTMAEKIDVSLTFYGDIERDKKGMSAETLFKLKTALGIDIDHLLTGHVNDKLNALQGISPNKAKYFEEIINALVKLSDL